jgi:MauM/NapG family ferredoxin protein
MEGMQMVYDSSMPDDRPLNRRKFFRQGLLELFKPLQNAAAPLHEVIKQLSAMDDEQTAVANHLAKKSASPKPAAVSKPITGIPIRPPGALPEQKFRETCSRCGDCVKVCPVQAIKIDPTGVNGAGAPYIDIDTAACVLCSGLLCMNKCPSGALVPTPLADIDMGTAIWLADTCLRSRGESCSICVDTCPVGEVAIKLDGNSITVLRDGCTGCGVCQNRCPTHPKSIVIKPRFSALTAAKPRSRPGAPSM